MTEPRRIVIAGGSGFIGRALTRAFADAGREVVVLTRDPSHCAGPARFVAWDGRTAGDWAKELDGAEAVINLTGKNVDCRYTRRALLEIDRSRVESVHAIAEAIERCECRPKTWVQASTTAIYGDRGEEWCDERSPIGDGVPTNTAAQWETAFHAVPIDGVRRVLLRISFALGRDGGALGKLAKLTRAYLGGTVGNGRQFISWIHIDDLVRLFVRAVDDATMQGQYIAATANPVTNADFMAALRRVLGRPWSPPTPAWAVRIGAFFLRTEPVLALTGRRCVPKRLQEAGFVFEFDELNDALLDVYGAVESESDRSQ